VSAPAENDTQHTQQALSGLFGSWFLRLIPSIPSIPSWKRYPAYPAYPARRWGFDRTIQGQCHKQKCSSHPDRLGFRVKGRWNAMDSWIREKLQCKHTISNFSWSQILVSFTITRDGFHANLVHCVSTRRYYKSNILRLLYIMLISCRGAKSCTSNFWTPDGLQKVHFWYKVG